MPDRALEAMQRELEELEKALSGSGSPDMRLAVAAGNAAAQLIKIRYELERLATATMMLSHK